eukprot:scaffold37261_cov74-Phaeocystis_antarctica.AAC.4
MVHAALQLRRVRTSIGLRCREARSHCLGLLSRSAPRVCRATTSALLRAGNVRIAWAISGQRAPRCALKPMTVRWCSRGAHPTEMELSISTTFLFGTRALSMAPEGKRLSHVPMGLPSGGDGKIVAWRHVYAANSVSHAVLGSSKVSCVASSTYVRMGVSCHESVDAPAASPKDSDPAGRRMGSWALETAVAGRTYA